MTEIPNWWLAVSAVFFVVNLVFLGVLSFVLIRVLQILQALQPRVERVLTQTETLAVKVATAATKVDEAATQLRDTSQAVGRRTRNVVGVMDSATSSMAPWLGRIMPGLQIGLTALRVFRAVRGRRR
jgi:uncharacterized protein YoxC